MEIPDEWDEYEMNNKEILHFFDKIIENVFKSLIASFGRFQQHKKNQKIQKSPAQMISSNYYPL